jgi:small-conductance mechanosensitive channel
MEAARSMSVQQGSFWDTRFLGLSIAQWLWVSVIIVVALLLQRFVAGYLRKIARRARLGPNVANGVVLTFRLLILLGALASLSRIGGIPTEWFVAFSAIGGAAVGLASTQTIGNFVAGLYLLAARPFRVGDLVRLGTVEGVVQEITINLTKVLTIGNNIVSITNLNVLQRDITNFLYQSTRQGAVYCYTFEIGFDHSVSDAKIEEIFNEVFAPYQATLPQAPCCTLTRSAAFDRVYLVYLYVTKPELVFDLKPQIMKQVFKRWDEERAKKTG